MREFSSGQQICGRFTLLGKLGSGGHGEVWRAREQNARREIALKVLFPSVAALPGAFASLEREYRISCRLPFPGILRVYPPVAGRDATVLPMAIAAGGDLRRLRGADSLQLVPLLIELARALEAAHTHGVVHRDLKPGNVLLDGAGHVKLADFGVAALDGETPPRRIGSPFNSSPQQLMGQPPTPADDMYGFGTLAYELLSGFPPFYPHFDPQRILAAAAPELQAVHECPIRLSTLVMRMLAKRPGDRPPSMAAVIEALEESLTDTLPFEGDPSGQAGEHAAHDDPGGHGPSQEWRVSDATPPPLAARDPVPVPLAGPEPVPMAVPTAMPPAGEPAPAAEEPPAVIAPTALILPAAEPLPSLAARPDPALDPADALLPVPPGEPHLGWTEPLTAPRWPYVVLAGIMLATAATLVILASLGPESRQALESTLRPTLAQTRERLAPERLRFERRLAELGDRDAALWGGAAFRAAEDAGRRASAAFDRADLGLADSLWQAGTRDLAEVAARAPTALAEQLEAGDRALAGGDPAAAAQAYAVARRIEPGDARAIAGLEHARSLGAAVNQSRSDAASPAPRPGAADRPG